ncbi:hypothetical protein C8Q76DRAFT_96368 [Earliella scabrosa]|nr:hypothetical protein C8Q76DRAFT_96368 [Earliella scabrosa]
MMSASSESANKAPDVEQIELGATGTKDATSKRESIDDAAPITGMRTTHENTASPLARLVIYGRQSKLYGLARDKLEEWHVRDKTKRFLKLCGLTLMLIFVVSLASFVMAFSHWFTIVFGHIVLHYVVPESFDPAYNKPLDQTMILATVGALVVNLPPFIIFLLSIPITFDRTVLEGSAAPANDFIKRITPKNRYALVFMKYAPRLCAAPIGSKIVWIFDEDPETYTLDPWHAFLAGVAGDLVLTGLGRLKNVLTGKRVAREAGAKSEGLPI